VNRAIAKRTALQERLDVIRVQVGDAMVVRDDAVLDAREAGLTRDQIAEAIGMTRDGVSKIIERANKRVAA
jgi:transcriptional regulator